MVSPTSEATSAPSARNVPYGSAYFIPPLTAMTMSPMTDPSDRRQHERQEHQLPAEERADHRQHLDVAAAHALLAGVAVVRLADQPQDAAAGQHADERTSSEPRRAARR